MSKVLPEELQANIKELRFMAIVMAICGLLTIVGIPWSLLYIALAAVLTAYIRSLSRLPVSEKIPSRKFITFVAFATIPICLFLVPIFLEVGLWRMIKKLKLYEASGAKAFRSNKEWQKVGFFRKQDLAVDMILLLVLLAGMLVPFPHTATKLVNIPYATKNIQDSSLELGDTQTRQPGSNGQGLERHAILKPIFAYILAKNVYYKNSGLPTQTTQAPVDQIVAQGTKRYQYMWCSNGAYRYYTSSQFSNQSTGFTHKSPDYCSQNGEGHMTGLADTAPPQQTTRTVYTPSYINTPTYTTCHDYSFINEFSCTSY